GSPHGRVVAVRSWVFVDDRSDDGVDDAQSGGRPTGARTVLEPFKEIAADTLLEAVDPVVQGLAGDAEAMGDLLGGVAVGEPEEGLGRATRRAGRGMADEVLKSPTLGWTEDQEAHGTPSALAGTSHETGYVSKNFCPAAYVGGLEVADVNRPANEQNTQPACRRPRDEPVHGRGRQRPGQGVEEGAGFPRVGVKQHAAARVLEVQPRVRCQITQGALDLLEGGALDDADGTLRCRRRTRG